MAVQIQLRNGTAAQWTSANPTLALGEVGVEKDTSKLKIGDGTTAWTSLGYAAVGTVTSVAASVPSFLSVTGSPITGSGTLALDYSGTALPVANGGTGQTAAGAAFNALSPITTTGDLILGNGANSATRLAIGANNYVLTSNGTTASWAASGSGSGLAWQSVQTANFTAVSGNAYPINTTSGSITATLPASPSAGNFVCLTDYAGTFATNNLLVNPNGSKLDGLTYDGYIQTARSSIHLVYIDATQGWIPYSGFNTQTPAQGYTVQYLVIAGGAGGGYDNGGGGGAGGYRSSVTGESSGGGATAESPILITPSVSYTVTVGAGGAVTVAGNNSVFGSITSVGGGVGGNQNFNGGNGGSGGGANNYSATRTGGTGTTGQGYGGGVGPGGAVSPYCGGGGGGAGAVGASGSNQLAGGAGVSSSINGTATTRGGGGGGGADTGGGSGAGGSGGGGTYNTAGTTNTGGGGGGGLDVGNGTAGGSGIVIIRYLGSQRGTGGTVTSSGGYTIHTFTTSGTYTG